MGARQPVGATVRRDGRCGERMPDHSAAAEAAHAGSRGTAGKAAARSTAGTSPGRSIASASTGAPVADAGAAVLTRIQFRQARVGRAVAS